MDYEKKYKEAFEKAKEYHKFSVSIPEDMAMLESIFPELKESEDERIRKALLETVHDTTGDELWVDYNVHKEEALAWLEKQGGHAKFINGIQVGDKVTRNEDGVLVNLSQLKRVAKKDENQYQTFTKKDVDDAYLKGICDAKHELENQGEQKPTDKVEPKFHEGKWIVYECGEETAWLKSLKEKVLPEPKQEWSEEDESRIITICTYLQDYARLSGSELRTTRINEYCDWLKSLRPQNRWKPSDLPHWKKSTLPNDNTTGFNSDYFCYKGYNINYKELFEKLPKDD